MIGQAGPHRDAHALEFVSAEQPYVDSLTLEQAGLHDVMLAYEMDGKPLPREHGAPLRLVIPEMYGYKNVKWLNGINLVPKAEDGYWEQLGYDRDAWVGRSNGYGRREALPAVLAHRADAALGERARLLRAARDRADALSPQARGARRPTAARAGHPFLVRGRLDRRAGR